MTIQETVKNTLKRYEMLPEGTGIVVGLSGGVDSITLLSVLWELRDEYDWKITALHVNHGIRGEAADRDEAFCRSFCGSRGIPFYSVSYNIPRLAKEAGEGEEECGRRIRYAYFREMGEVLYPEGFRIATAHHAGDNAETALFRLFRGTSLHGLTGIPPVRDNIVRPLLFCTREEIEAYAAEHDLPFCTDCTNTDVTYARNRIRHRILPEAEKINGNAVGNLSRSLQIFSREDSYMEEQTEILLSKALLSTDPRRYATPVIREAHEALQYRAVVRILETLTGTGADLLHAEEIVNLLESGGTVQVPSGRSVQIDAEKICLQEASPDPLPDFAEEGRDGVTLPYGTFHIRILDRNAEFNGAYLENALDYDKINGDFVVRNRRPGDRFQMPGRAGHKTLKSLFAERSVPAGWRDRITVAEQDGILLWMEGFGPSEEACVTEETERIALLSVTRTDAFPKREH